MSRALKTISIVVGITTIPMMLRYFIRKKYEQLLRDLEKFPEDNSYYECIFFDYRNFCCKPHLINKQECGDHCSYMRLERLLHYISSAKKSISMCIYMVTLKQIKDELINAAKRGVCVRFITDKVSSRNGPVKFNLSQLCANGVQCLTSPSEHVMMHHKFCLIDEKDSNGAKVFFGSINLTAQAFCQNFEALIFTNNPDITKRLSDEFEQLWSGFNCNPACHLSLQV